MSRLIPISRRIFGDHLTPVLAYRRLVAPDQRTAPSFLFESVDTAGNVGRHSFLGAQPSLEITAKNSTVAVTDHARGYSSTSEEHDPLAAIQRLARSIETDSSALPRQLSGVFCGGWVGYAGYDTARWLEPVKLPFTSAPVDDRNLPDLHLALYRHVVIFDHVDKTIHVVAWVESDRMDSASAHLDQLVDRLQAASPPLPAGDISLDLSQKPSPPSRSASSGQTPFQISVARAKNYIAAGDIFQVVLSQRFERTTTADPFDIYRALRVVNPSPYQIYLQAGGCILVAASPEILCRVRNRTVVNRPLAGTRPRGSTAELDRSLEAELLRDEKERAEHIMLVDLGRNDLGRVCDVGSISLDRIMDVERYSHVMHLSSTVSGSLRDDLDAWDALRATLPAGTVSGAPKIRAMQIIDELEPLRRGPYGGGIGLVTFDGDMEMALALRTMVIPTAGRTAAGSGAPWTVHLQAGAGIVADSNPDAENEETLNKAAALGRAIDLAEHAFNRRP